MTEERKVYRTEWKYVCNEGILALVGARLAPILPLDRHAGPAGTYRVRSVYFDDLKNACMYDNDSGVSLRYKYRMRYYGNDTQFLRLERKEKCNGRCYKESCRVRLDEAEALLDGRVGDVLWNADSPVLRRFCVLCLSRGFAPKCIVDYVRTAYVDDTLHLRITMDRNVVVSADVDRFLTGDYAVLPVQEQGRHVFEVKFDSVLPGHVRAAALHRGLIQSAFSKYSLGRATLHRMRGCA